MNIYLWNTSKKVADALEPFSASFVRDLKDGGTRLICGFCGTFFNHLMAYKNIPATHSCPHCNEDVVFGRYDW